MTGRRVRSIPALFAGVAGAAVIAAASAGAAGDAAVYQQVDSGRPLTFPADYGSHPNFRTEWWYVTGGSLRETASLSVSR